MWLWITNRIPFWGRCIQIRTDFSGDWDVHWEYGILTHNHVSTTKKMNFTIVSYFVSAFDRFESSNAAEAFGRAQPYKRGRAHEPVRQLVVWGLAARNTPARGPYSRRQGYITS